MADEPNIPPSGRSDSSADQPISDANIPVDKFNRQGVASEQTPLELGNALAEAINQSDTLASQEIDAARLITPPHLTVPQFAQSLYQRHQFDYRKLYSQIRNTVLPDLQQKPSTSPGNVTSGSASDISSGSDYDRVMATMRTTASLGAYQFLRSTGLSYMRKSLALGYHQASALKTLNITLGDIGRMMESKLEAIKINTSKPEDKKSSWRDKIIDSAKKKVFSNVEKVAEKKALEVFSKHIGTPLLGHINRIRRGEETLSQALDHAKRSTGYGVVGVGRKIRSVTNRFNNRLINRVVDGVGRSVGSIGDKVNKATLSPRVQSGIQRVNDFIGDKFSVASTPDLMSSGSNSDTTENAAGAADLKNQADANQPLMQPWWLTMQESANKTHVYLERIIELMPRPGQFSISSNRQTITPTSSTQEASSSEPTGPNIARTSTSSRLRVKLPRRVSRSQPIQGSVPNIATPVTSSLETGPSSPLRPIASSLPAGLMSDVETRKSITPRRSFGTVFKQTLGSTGSAIGDGVTHLYGSIPSVYEKLKSVGGGVTLGAEGDEEISRNPNSFINRLKNLVEARRAYSDDSESDVTEEAVPHVGGSQSIVEDDHQGAVRERTYAAKAPDLFGGILKAVGSAIGAAASLPFDILGGRRASSPEEAPRRSRLRRIAESVGRTALDSGAYIGKKAGRGASIAGRYAAKTTATASGAAARGTGRAGLGAAKLTGKGLWKGTRLGAKLGTRAVVRTATTAAELPGRTVNRWMDVKSRPHANPVITDLQKHGVTRTILKNVMHPGITKDDWKRTYRLAKGVGNAIVDPVNFYARAGRKGIGKLDPASGEHIDNFMQNTRTGRHLSLIGKAASGISRYAVGSAAGSMLELGTDAVTQKGSIANRLGHTAASALEYGTLGSVFGPMGTAVGAALGAVVANLDFVSSGAKMMGAAFHGVGRYIVGGKGDPQYNSDGSLKIRGDQGLPSYVNKSLFGQDIKYDSHGNPIFTSTGPIKLNNPDATGLTSPQTANTNTPALVPANSNTKAFVMPSQAPGGYVYGTGVGSSLGSGISLFGTKSGVMKAQQPVDSRQISDQPEYKAVLTKLSPALQKKVSSSKALQFVVWSTAIQQGKNVNAAVKVIEDNFDPTEDDKTLIRKIYQQRTTQFADAAPAERITGISQLGNEQSFINSYDDKTSSHDFAAAAKAAGAQVPAMGDTTIPASFSPGSSVPRSFGGGSSGGGSRTSSLINDGIYRTPAIGKTPPPLKGTLKERAKIALDRFVSHGWTPEQAAGIVASLKAESKFDPYAKQNGQMYGVGLPQWSPDRQAIIAKQFGKPVLQMTYEEQLDAIDWELRHNEKSAGNALKKAKTPAEAGNIMSRAYERPKDKDGQAAIRTASAVQIATDFGIGSTYKTPAEPGTLASVAQNNTSGPAQMLPAGYTSKDAGSAAGAASGSSPQLIQAPDYSTAGSDSSGFDAGGGSTIASAGATQNAANGTPTKSPLLPLSAPASTASNTQVSSYPSASTPASIPVAPPSLMAAPPPAAVDSSGAAPNEYSGVPNSVVANSSKLNNGMPHSTFDTGYGQNGQPIFSTKDLAKSIDQMIKSQGSQFTKMIDHLSKVADNTEHLSKTNDLLSKVANKPTVIAPSSTTVHAPTSQPAANNDMSLMKTGSASGII